ncbi:DNA-binding CsgD family transcriptional regulator/PAS domain-containing protein [Rhodoblastus acidophilus]|uniref:helix-turn-helix transcriptional regulator n=1 Tax=Rhodoblastus acidophilus TaxID=1074 RepID=UPI0022253B6A|nr:helix-turn-helix transcriptional regulator [Rhodoblastus acidophilus]MCW2283688.1 DNA-binding CsgD family transcriptional regulator/PAS domain-containing protein [Rhodoblastus acidophilus]MCW2332963.1 DNA-binding CsgD family transcriptional regulator/PAS domain-containing protein [Rhodoblastus acidophilus]
MHSASRALLTACATQTSVAPAMRAISDAMGASLIYLCRFANQRPYIFAPPDERASAFLANKAPPMSQLHVLLEPGKSGFSHTLHADWLRQARRDPFYNEFMRPNDMTQRYATPVLNISNAPLALNIIRDPRLRPYDDAELAEFATVIPHLQAAVLVAQEFTRLRAQAQAAPYERRGEAVFRLDYDGRVIGMNAEAEQALSGPVRLVNGRLTSASPLDQKRVDQAISRAIRHLRPTMERIDDGQGAARYLLVAMPVDGDARDIFCSASAVVALVDTARRLDLSDALLCGLRSAFGATQREAEVAALIATGLNVEGVAARLQIGLGTVRTHLKTAMHKMNVRSQTELAALIARLS